MKYLVGKKIVNRKKLLGKLAGNSFNNVSFSDARDLAEGFGFRLARIRGDHYIFIHPEMPLMINLQEVGGEAKPYQLRQLLRLVERYNLKLGDDGK